MAANPKVKVIHEQTSQHSQGFDHTRVADITHWLYLDGDTERRPQGARGQVLVRTTIHLDTSVHYQSRARIELWTPNGWTLVHCAPGEALPWPAQGRGSVKMIDDIVFAFERIAREIV